MGTVLSKMELSSILLLVFLPTAAGWLEKREFLSLDACIDKVKDVLDVAEIPECCNNADILLNYGECCKDLFNGGEEACYQDPQTTATIRPRSLRTDGGEDPCYQDPAVLAQYQATTRPRSLRTLTSSYSTYSINWCQSEIRRATDLKADPICCLNPFIRDKFKNDQEYRNECCIKLGLCADEKRRSFPISGCVCSLNYCPYKFRGSGWITNYSECCYHPVRKYLPRSYPYLNKAECCTKLAVCF